MIWKLVKDAPVEKIKGTPFEAHFAGHGRSPFPNNAVGVPWTSAYVQSQEDPIANLHEDMAAEQKARASYNSLIQLSDDPGVTDDPTAVFTIITYIFFCQNILPKVS